MIRVIQRVQRNLLRYHLEKWPQNEVPFSVFKPPPLQTSGGLGTCEDCTKLFELRESWPISLGINPFQPTLSFGTSILKIFDSACTGCHFCILQLIRLLKGGAVTRDIQYAHITWWRYWNGDHDNADDDSSYSKDFRIRYLSRNLETIHFDYYITVPLTELDQGT
jgi:hypothetical protein